MSKWIEHTNGKKFFMADNAAKMDKEQYIDELVARLTEWSDKILSYDPKLIEERGDLMYEEDGIKLWRTNMIRQMPEFDMYQLKTILEKRYEQRKYNPYYAQLSQSSRLDVNATNEVQPYNESTEQSDQANE